MLDTAGGVDVLRSTPVAVDAALSDQHRGRRLRDGSLVSAWPERNTAPEQPAVTSWRLAADGATTSLASYPLPTSISGWFALEVLPDGDFVALFNVSDSQAAEGPASQHAVLLRLSPAFAVLARKDFPAPSGMVERSLSVMRNGMLAMTIAESSQSATHPTALVLHRMPSADLR